MPLNDRKIINPITTIQVLPDKPNASLGLSAEQMKEKFDNSPEALRREANGIIDDLVADTGASEIGVSGAAASVQAEITSAKGRLDTAESNITTIDGKADTAISTANAATSTANTASSNASAAVATANAASSSASAAVSTANAADAKADTAISTANAATTTANNAASSASAAQTAAEDAAAAAQAAEAAVALKADVAYVDQVAANFQLGEVLPNSIIDDQLSNTAGQIKDRVATNTANIATNTTNIATNTTNIATNVTNIATAQAAADSKATEDTLTGTLTTSWVGASAPYSQAVTVTGILASDNPVLDVVMSGTFATDEIRQEDWGKVYRAVTTANTITFYATEVTTASIPFQAKVVR